MHLRNFLISSCLVPFLAVGGSITALAEEEEAEKITVVGTRSHERSAADLAVPVDSLDATTLLRQGASRMEDMLSRVAPSLNVSQEPLSDAGTLVRPANMRGLPPDSTLVLVNGKRRHRSSVITFLGNGLNDGAHGVDLSAIPAIALDRVEVLRDNAGAQYGSDAVAGIINFVLKEDSEGGSLDARWGQYYEGDGESVTVAGNIGLPLTENGFLNLSAEYNEADPTYRSTQSGRSNYLIDAGNQHVRMNPPPIVWGAPDITDNYKLFANAAIGLGALHEAYAFGNYAERTVDGGFYFRSPRRRGGIFAGDQDESIPIRDEQQPSIVIDQMPWLEGRMPFARVGCMLNVEQSAKGEGTELDTIEATERCYAFNLKFPGGFTPQFGGDIEDTSFAFGIRGELTEDFTYDISYVYGRHEVDHFIYNTINPNLARLENDIPTSYNPGGYVETDYTFNLDFTTQIDVDAFYSPLHVGFGVEYREEEFETKRGELNSWFIDYYQVDLDADGDEVANSGREFEEPANLASMSCQEYQKYSARKDLIAKYPDLGVGSNGFTGFPPCAEGKEDRSSIGAYIDFEADVTENVLMGLALRHEDPEEFDSTLDGKFSARFQATDELAIRSSVGTGFRVPTVGQANVQNVTTGITNGQLIDQLTLPPTHALLEGIAEPLDAEESTSFGLGAVVNVGGFDLTIDYYHIEVDDRIGQTSKEPIDCLLMRKAGHSGACADISKSGAIDDESRTSSKREFSHVLRDEAQDESEDEPALTEAEMRRLDDAVTEREALRSAVPAIDAIGEAKYFANDFDTTTEGIDIVATYPMEFLDGLTTLTFAANWNRTKIDKFNPRTINARKKHIIEDGRPKVRWTLTAEHESGPWQILGRVRYYGSHVDYAGAGLENDITLAEARTLVDLEATYHLTDNFAFSLGAENLLDNEPTRHAHQGSYGNLYPESTPFDYNGGFYYAKAMLNF